MESRQVRRHRDRMATKGHASAIAAQTTARAKALSGAKKVDQMFPEKRTIDPDAEKLVAVALIDEDGNTHHGWKSHSDLRRSLGRKDPYTADPTDQYGFWTSAERFVTRDQAKYIGVTSGQLSKDWLNVGRDLLSSDVW